PSTLRITGDVQPGVGAGVTQAIPARPQKRKHFWEFLKSSCEKLPRKNPPVESTEDLSPEVQRRRESPGNRLEIAAWAILGICSQDRIAPDRGDPNRLCSGQVRMKRQAPTVKSRTLKCTITFKDDGKWHIGEKEVASGILRITHASARSMRFPKGTNYP